MAIIAAQDVRGVTGKAITYVAATSGAGDKAPVGDDLYLLVKNASASPITVTLASVGTVFNGTDIPDTVITVAVGDRMIPLSTNYRAESDGLAAITYSAVATVTVAVIQA